MTRFIHLFYEALKSTGSVRRVRDLSDFDPGRRRRNPYSHLLRRLRILQLVENGLRDEDALVESGEDIRLVDEDEVVERRGVGDDDRHYFAARFSKSVLLVSASSSRSSGE